VAACGWKAVGAASLFRSEHHSSAPSWCPLAYRHTVLRADGVAEERGSGPRPCHALMHTQTIGHAPENKELARCSASLNPQAASHARAHSAHACPHSIIFNTQPPPHAHPAAAGGAGPELARPAGRRQGARGAAGGVQRGAVLATRGQQPGRQRAGAICRRVARRAGHGAHAVHGGGCCARVCVWICVCTFVCVCMCGCAWVHLCVCVCVWM